MKLYFKTFNVSSTFNSFLNISKRKIIYKIRILTRKKQNFNHKYIICIYNVLHYVTSKKINFTEKMKIPMQSLRYSL